MIYIVMGVSGCGKSTVGSLLAKRLSIPFYDADDFHLAENIEKMSNGIPLTDDDRSPWLNLLAKQIIEWEKTGGAVLACSALKQSYRDILCSTTKQVVQFIYLKGDQEVLSSRLRNRESHYMPESLLQSQLATLEEPKEGVTVSITHSLEDVLSEILVQISEL